MTKRLDKVKLVKGRRWERQDPIDNIGVSTYELLRDAIKEGKNQLAKDLTDYLWDWEIKLVYDVNNDLCGGIPSFWMTNYGEDTLYEPYREMLYKYYGKKGPVWIGKRDLNPYDFAMEDHVWRMVRLHRMGKNEGTGGFVINEYEDRYEILWDPCYSGGRTRRGDPLTGTRPYTEAPYNFACNRAPHWWTEGKTGVTGYCIHCFILHEIMDVEQTGYLGQWIVAYPENPWDPCPYICYKDVDWIPEKYYARLGFKKPKSAKPIPKFKDTTKILKVTHSDELGRMCINTVTLLKRAIDAGDKEEALNLVTTLNAEREVQQFTRVRWNWGWFDILVRKYGYNELYHILRSIYNSMEPTLLPDEPKPTKSQIPSAEERVRKAAVWARGDRCGPDGSSVKIIDEPDRIVMEMNPCGSGGRSLLSIKLDKAALDVAKEFKLSVPSLERGPLTESPWNFAVTTEANPVAWGKVGIQHYCTRCCVHFSMATIARTGYLTTVIDHQKPGNPNCRWYFYKDLDDVPEKFYKEIGAVKPPKSKK
ncbi:MAG: hypothetical protein V1767_06495 [Chloroflexota bacterium]